MGDLYRAILDRIVSDPDLPITELSPVDIARLKVDGKTADTSILLPRKKAKGYASPQTEVERILANVWQASLGVQRVDIHDDFFELGGHSILAAQVCVEAERRLNQRVPLALFFGAPNIHALAKAIANKPAQHGAITIVPLQPSGSRAPLFLMPSISGLPLPSKNLLEGVDLDRPIFAVGLTEPTPPWNDRASLQEIAGYFADALRRQTNGSTSYLGIFIRRNASLRSRSSTSGRQFCGWPPPDCRHRAGAVAREFAVGVLAKPASLHRQCAAVGHEFRIQHNYIAKIVSTPPKVSLMDASLRGGDFHAAGNEEFGRCNRHATLAR